MVDFLDALLSGDVLDASWKTVSSASASGDCRANGVSKAKAN
jgi:hypothetical protein